MTKNKGFTLVEIMIVVVIIGLLAAMAVPAFQQVRKSSSEKAALNDLRQIAAAADQYFLENNVASVNVSVLTTDYIKSLNSKNTYPTSIAATMTQITATTAFGTVNYDL